MPKPNPAEPPFADYGPSSYGASFADVYDEWYADVSDVEATVATIAALAGQTNGRVLELGVGSGRLAVPLAAAGVPVVGLDASAAMTDRLPADAGVSVVLGDIAAPPLRRAGQFGVIFVAFNTFFNLTTEAAQRAALDAVAALLAPDGRFVLEAFVPPDPDLTPRSAMGPKTIELDRVVLTATQVDPDQQRIIGQHIELTEAGGVRLRPWQLRYLTPTQLDQMAADAGLTLDRRDADWSGQPFDETSAAHVSVYRRR
ncbi:MAG: class I SAM-dependent methyltransferase [Acidimicrobiales bacterium]|nr:class I SAM-dependent methyltransferase [Acidimicrobiales bacterium]